MKPMDKQNYEIMRFATTLQACLSYSDCIVFNLDAMARALAFLSQMADEQECLKGMAPMLGEYRETIVKIAENCGKINKLSDQILESHARIIVDLMADSLTEDRMAKEAKRSAEEGEQ